MSNFSRIIFVDQDNTCLSILAEARLQALRMQKKVGILSRGLVVLLSEPVNAKAALVLAAHSQKPLRSKSQELSREDIDDKTLILTMTEQEKRRILENFMEANFVYTLREFAGEQGDVEEPCGDLENYERCYGQIDRLVTAVGEILFKEDKVNDSAGV